MMYQDTMDATQYTSTAVSGKVVMTMSKVIMGSGDFTVVLHRNVNTNWSRLENYDHTIYTS